MKYYFITGASKGIGRALAAELLDLSGTRVFGISRTSHFNKENYIHFHLDLGDVNAVSGFRFPDLKDASGIYLVNNAGTLGEVGHCGNLHDEKIISGFHVNIVSPALLCNKFIEQYRKHDCEKVIVNISSGAAQRPVDGWSIYCAAKSAINMLSETVQRECDIDKNGIRVFAIAPGIVDTAMQEQIRHASKKDFSEVEKFIEYKESGQLQHPEVVARRLIDFMERNKNQDQVVLSLKSAS